MRTVSALLLLASAAALASAAVEKVTLSPKYSAGQTLRYRVVMRTASRNNTTTPIINPEGGSEFKQSVTIVVRLEFLAPSNAAPAAASAASGIPIRATFEQSTATVESDAVNPAAPPPEDRYKKLADRSIEFTITPAGEFTSFAGLEGIRETSASAASFFAWLPGLIERSNLPARAIAIGEKWSVEHALDGLPLTGLTFRSESSYVRDEACPVPTLEAALASPPVTIELTAKPESCAVILTHFTIAHPGSPRADATPPDYLKNGLRTMGKWSATGEGLDSISIASGVLLTSTQSSAQDTDYTITSASSGSKIHEQSHVTTETEITQLAPEGPKT